MSPLGRNGPISNGVGREDPTGLWGRVVIDNCITVWNPAQCALLSRTIVVGVWWTQWSSLCTAWDPRSTRPNSVERLPTRSMTRSAKGNGPLTAAVCPGV
jgi:hypothetical protein